MTKQREFFTSYLTELSKAIEKVDLQTLEKIMELLIECRDAGRFIYAIGNGSSALTADHAGLCFGKENSYSFEKKFRIFPLTGNIATITAYGNDVEYADIFVEQVKNVAEKGDILLAFSGSGNSENIIRAVEYCKEVGATTIGLTGKPGGRLAQLADYVFQAETEHMGRIEEIHLIVVHLLSYYLLEQ